MGFGGGTRFRLWRLRMRRGCSRGLERAMGLEPTTTCLGSRYATTASRPLAGRILAPPGPIVQ